MDGSPDEQAPYGDHGPSWALRALGVGVILGLPAVWDSADWAAICALAGAILLSLGGSELARLLDARRGRPTIRGADAAFRLRERRLILSGVPLPAMVCGLIAGFLAAALTNSVLLGGLAIVVVSAATGTLFQRSLYAGESVGTRIATRMTRCRR